ncbi:hypothetical protein B484DRAFT_451596 [Ochromonadaceae sp. CCMP2298]|nr:hypothetical protein B484DRAFT_451596 [Ochromonadaceae sp. CCMP2298]
MSVAKSNSRDLFASSKCDGVSDDSQDDDADTAKSSVRNISPQKREWVRKESEAILTKNLMLREKTKQNIFEKRLQHEKLLAFSREKRDHRWKDKTKHSPFAVNLVAEDERITEENTIRLKEENERRTKMESRKEKAKNEIILKALSEFSDLEALRREKRAIMEEEQRLKALLSLEKVTLTGKADRLIAERAQRQRKEAKLSHRRNVYKDSLDQVLEEERQALMRKHAMSMSISTRDGSANSRLTTGNSNFNLTGASTPAAMAAMSSINY